MISENTYEEREDAAAAEWQREQIQRRLERLHSARPPVFAAPGELAPEVAEWCDRYLDGEPGGLLLCGPTGVGKSWTLWAIAERLVLAGWGGRFVRATAAEFRRAVAPPVDWERLDLWSGADLLALDDLGSQRVSDWDAGHVLDVLDQRSERRRPTIITSNVPKIRTLLGERSASRLREDATVVQLSGSDRRELRR